MLGALVENFLQGVNLYLIGMMGAGKSTLGQVLATQLGYRFFDSDRLIEQLAGQSVSEIFASSGETEFRQLETQVLAELSAYTRLVVATGGGIVLKRENWSYLRHGIVVWLDVPIDQLQQRLQADTSRPLLQQGDLTNRLETLLSQRQDLYDQADVRVTYQPGEPLEELATRVLEMVRQVLKPPQLPPEHNQN